MIFLFNGYVTVLDFAKTVITDSLLTTFYNLSKHFGLDNVHVLYSQENYMYM